MRVEGYLIDNETGTGTKVIAVDLHPCTKFPDGGYALKIAATQRIMLLYNKRASASQALFLMRQQALSRGFLLYCQGDEAYEETVSTAKKETDHDRPEPA